MDVGKWRAAQGKQLRAGRGHERDSRQGQGDGGGDGLPVTCDNCCYVKHLHSLPSLPVWVWVCVGVLSVRVYVCVCAHLYVCVFEHQCMIWRNYREITPTLKLPHPYPPPSGGIWKLCTKVTSTYVRGY